MRYAVVIEKADGNYSAYVPDLPGRCHGRNRCRGGARNPGGDPLSHRRPPGRQPFCSGAHQHRRICRGVSVFKPEKWL